jgi:hypothetical protein
MYVNRKMIAVEIILGMGGGKNKREGRRSEFKYNIFDIL